MPFGPIQMLDLIVDPEAYATLTDDGVDGQTPPGTPGSEGGGLDSGGVLDPRTGHYVRHGGSGARNTGAKVLPTAVNDSLDTTVGASSTDVNVLVNDTYSGTPSIVIISGPLLPGATAVVVGTGASSRVRYTPPSGGGAQADEIVYRLRATGNANGSGNLRQRDTATLFVTVADNTPDPHVGGSYHVTNKAYTSTDDGCYGGRFIGAFSWPQRTTVAGDPDTNPGGNGYTGPCGSIFPGQVYIVVNDDAEYFDVVSGDLLNGTFTLTSAIGPPTDMAFNATFTPDP